jgi:uncharacterized protein (DUF2141 family)
VSARILAERAPRATALIVACGFLFGGAAWAGEPATLAIAVHGADYDSGFVHVALYNKASWNSSVAEPVRTASRHPGGPATVIVLSDVKPGRYVVEAYQDRDNNGRVDGGDPHGISQNACLRKSDCHPAFQDVYVAVKAGDNAISIDLD